MLWFSDLMVDSQASQKKQMRNPRMYACKITEVILKLQGRTDVGKM